MGCAKCPCQQDNVSDELSAKQCDWFLKEYLAVLVSNFACDFRLGQATWVVLQSFP